MRYRTRVAFALLAIIEIALIVLAARWLGGWVVFWLMVATSLLGGWVVRNEGVRAWTALTEAVRAGRAPDRDMAASRSAIIGGFLMIIPGFVTDLLGAALVLPVTRPVATRILSRLRPSGGYGPGPAQAPPTWHGDVIQGDVIEGEIVDRDEPPQY